VAVTAGPNGTFCSKDIMVWIVMTAKVN
jgi:hypothetical protein